MITTLSSNFLTASCLTTIPDLDHLPKVPPHLRLDRVEAEVEITTLVSCGHRAGDERSGIANELRYSHHLVESDGVSLPRPSKLGGEFFIFCVNRISACPVLSSQIILSV